MAELEWVDPLSPKGLRETTAKVLTGTNYRVFYEDLTRRKLVETYSQLAELANSDAGDQDAWKESVRRHISTSKSTEDMGLRYWLIGLTTKTAANLGYTMNDLPALFDQLIVEIEASPRNVDARQTALLLWAGAATLTIRGSQKSKVGKALEKAIARAALTVIGLKEGQDAPTEGDFWLNLGADLEVSRETDAEIRTERGRIRMEVGMIGKGNSEVISDKVGRLSRNDVILTDALPSKSAAYEVAAQRGVKLIPLRNNHPVEELRQHLRELNSTVQAKALTTREVERRVLRMPLKAFRI